MIFEYDISYVCESEISRDLKEMERLMDSIESIVYEMCRNLEMSA